MFVCFCVCVCVGKIAVCVCFENWKRRSFLGKRERDNLSTISSLSVLRALIWFWINTCFTIYPFLCVLYNSTILLLRFLIGQLIPTVHFRYQIVKYLILTFYGFSCLLCILQFYVIHVSVSLCVCLWGRVLCYCSLSAAARTEAQKKTRKSPEVCPE